MSEPDTYNYNDPRYVTRLLKEGIRNWQQLKVSAVKDDSEGLGRLPNFELDDALITVRKDENLLTKLYALYHCQINLGGAELSALDFLNHEQVFSVQAGSRQVPCTVGVRGKYQIVFETERGQFNSLSEGVGDSQRFTILCPEVFDVLTKKAISAQRVFSKLSEEQIRFRKERHREKEEKWGSEQAEEFAIRLRVGLFEDQIPTISATEIGGLSGKLAEERRSYRQVISIIDAEQRQSDQVAFFANLMTQIDEYNSKITGGKSEKIIVQLRFDVPTIQVSLVGLDPRSELFDKITKMYDEIFLTDSNAILQGSDAVTQILRILETKGAQIVLDKQSQNRLRQERVSPEMFSQPEYMDKRVGVIRFGSTLVEEGRGTFVSAPTIHLRAELKGMR